MIERPIAVGDLVQCVRPRLCCGDAAGIGRVFTVTGLDSWGICFRCGTKDVPVARLGIGLKCEIARLKRIPPLEELEKSQTTDDIREPA